MASERKIVRENVRRVLLRDYLMKETLNAGFGGLDIQRTPMGTRVTLVVERPGLVIGRKGSTINALTEAMGTRFKFDNPQIEVQEVESAALNAQIMAEKLANALERGWHFRRAGHSTVRRIMGAGAKGCLIIVAGKLTGQRHRTQKFKAGHIKYCGEPSYTFMRHGFAIARMKPGVIGVTVRVMDPKAKLPDEITIQAAPSTPTTVVPVPAPVTLPAEPVDVAPEGEDTAEADLPVDDAAEALPKTGKLAAKKLKKVTKVLHEQGGSLDAGVDG